MTVRNLYETYKTYNILIFPYMSLYVLIVWHIFLVFSTAQIFSGLMFFLIFICHYSLISWPGWRILNLGNWPEGSMFASNPNCRSNTLGGRHREKQWKIIEIMFLVVSFVFLIFFIAFCWFFLGFVQGKDFQKYSPNIL